MLVSLELREAIKRNEWHFFKRKNQNNKELSGNKKYKRRKNSIAMLKVKLK